MKIQYAKTALYAYPNIEEVAEQIDELVERKALASMRDCSPALEQCEKIVDFTIQKSILFALKIMVEEVLSKLTLSEMDCLEYKYFKRKPKEYFFGFDAESRGYFRRQIKLAEKISDRLEKVGVTDEWFEQNCLQMDFFNELLKRVIEHEESVKKDSKTQGVHRQNKQENNRGKLSA